MGLDNMIRQLTRIPMMIMAPLMGLFVSFRRYLNLRSLWGKLAGFLGRLFKKVFGFKPKNMGDYYKIGHYFVFKNLLVIIILVICLIPFIYFRFVAPPGSAASKQTVAGYKTFVHHETALKDYTGLAKVLSGNRILMYEGNVSSGVASGEGTLFNPDEIVVYEGSFKDNMYDGEGREYYGETGNPKYVGMFKENEYNGQGLLYYPDGVTRHYEGTFYAGKFNGVGILYDENGQKRYEGSFVLGEKNGEGKLYDELGRLIFEGTFKNDEINVSAFLGDTKDNLALGYKTAPTTYTFDSLSNTVVEFEEFGDLFLFDSGGRIDKIIRVDSSKTFDAANANYFGETYADEADMAALNFSGLRNDFRTTLSGAWYTDNVYRPQLMYMRAFVEPDVVYTVFYEDELAEEPLYYVITRPE